MRIRPRRRAQRIRPASAISPARPCRFEISGSQYAPLAWADIAGWNDDDHLAAYKAFRTSCKPIVGAAGAGRRSEGAGRLAARSLPRRQGRRHCPTAPRRKAFFERHFLPLRISRLGEGEGFVTGYYEPVIDGSRTQTDVYNVPVYRRPSNLFVRGFKQDSAGLAQQGRGVSQDRPPQAGALLRSRPRSRTARSPAAASKSAG